MNKNNLWEKTLKSEKIYSGRVVHIRKDEVTLPNGTVSTREIVEHPEAVVILAQNNSGQLIMVKQFRKAVEAVLLELPAGTIEPQEDNLSCARRELEEETGYQAKKWEKIFEFYSSPGFCDEKLSLYLARDLVKTASNTDHDEFIEIVELNKEKIRSLVKRNEIRDAKTLLGLLWWLNL